MARRRKRSTASSIVATIALAVGALGGSTAGATGTRSTMAAASGKTVEVSGWATFSGRALASNADPKADGVPSAEAAHEAGAELISASFIYRPEQEDFFTRLEVTKIPGIQAGLTGVQSAGDPTTLYAVHFRIGNKAFEVRAQSLPGVAFTPIRPQFGLFTCETEEVCTEQKKLAGGYGTTGEAIVVAIPLKDLRDLGAKVAEGGKISGLLALTARANYLSGPVSSALYMDQVVLTRAAQVTIPKRSVTVIVGEGSKVATLDKGRFTASLARKFFTKNPMPVKTRTCFGTCVTQSFKVRY